MRRISRARRIVNGYSDDGSGRGGRSIPDDMRVPALLRRPRCGPAVAAPCPGPSPRRASSRAGDPGQPGGLLGERQQRLGPAVEPVRARALPGQPLAGARRAGRPCKPPSRRCPRRPGITFVYDGTTSFTPSSGHWNQPAPLVIAFAHPAGQTYGTSYLSGGNQLGEGGYESQFTSVHGRITSYKIIEGYAVIDASGYDRADAHVRTAVLLHELGHAVGPEPRVPHQRDDVPVGLRRRAELLQRRRPRRPRQGGSRSRLPQLVGRRDQKASAPRRILPASRSA